MGQVLQAVKMSVPPEKVYLINRIDGIYITPTDIRNNLRMIHGKGV